MSAMKIKTFSIVTGNAACNAKCPFCVSKMTGNAAGCIRGFNDRNFSKACQLAKDCGVTTAMMTGIGEPLLDTTMIGMYLDVLNHFKFPFIELQTNGIKLMEDTVPIVSHRLKSWYERGLTTINLSCVHWEEEKNKEIYGKYHDLENLVKMLHDFGFGVRLGVTMVKGYIDTMKQVDLFVQWVQTRKFSRPIQLTFRPVTAPPNENGSKGAFEYVEKNSLDINSHIDMQTNLGVNGNLLMKLGHGAFVYDYKGQNVCITNCLTHNADPEEVRQLIYFPDGSLRYDWVSKAAILI